MKIEDNGKTFLGVKMEGMIKAKSIDDYMVALNTTRLVIIHKLTMKANKMLDNGNLPKEELNALAMAESLFNSKIAVSVHELLMNVDDNEYRINQELHKQMQLDRSTLGDFLLHMIEKPGNDIKTFMESDEAPEKLNTSETFLINDALDKFKDEIKRKIDPNMRNPKKIFDQLELAFNSARDGEIPTFEQIYLSWMFIDEYYDSWSDSDELKLDQETIFIARFKVKK